MALRNVIVQAVFKIVLAGTILKNICGVEWDILGHYFNRLAEILNVALFVPLMVHEHCSELAMGKNHKTFIKKI